MKKTNDKKIYTGIIRVKDKTTYIDNRKGIVIISDVKILGRIENSYILIRVQNIRGFKHLKPGDVVKFNAYISTEHIPGHIMKSNIFDIDELKKIPHLIDVTNILHLSHEKNNNNIKLSLCGKCSTLIYYKEKNTLCSACLASIDKSRRRGQKRTQISTTNRKTKTCRICGKTHLKVTHFVNRKGTKDGYSNICIYCK